MTQVHIPRSIIRMFMFAAMCGLLLIGVVALTRPAAVVAQDSTAYTVQPGDTVETIAARLNVSAVSILTANDLTVSSILYVGDMLVIPADVPAFGLVPPLTRFVPVDGQGGGGTFYVVQPRDVLDLIASYFNIDLACLLEQNGLTSGLIFPGQTLLLPDSCPPYRGLSTAAARQLGGLAVRDAQGGSAATMATPTAQATLAPATEAPVQPTQAAATPAPAQPTPTQEVLVPPTLAPTAAG